MSDDTKQFIVAGIVIAILVIGMMGGGALIVWSNNRAFSACVAETKQPLECDRAARHQ